MSASGSCFGVVFERAWPEAWLELLVEAERSAPYFSLPPPWADVAFGVIHVILAVYRSHPVYPEQPA